MICLLAPWNIHTPVAQLTTVDVASVVSARTDTRVSVPVCSLSVIGL